MSLAVSMVWLRETEWYGAGDGIIFPLVNERAPVVRDGRM